MNESMSQAEVHPLETRGRGVLASAIALGADTVERSLQATLEVVEAVRRESFHVTFAGLELVETVQQSAMKLVREVVGRADKASEQVVDGVEATALALARAVRGSGELAGEMVARTAESLTRGTPAKAA